MAIYENVDGVIKTLAPNPGGGLSAIEYKSFGISSQTYTFSFTPKYVLIFFYESAGQSDSEQLKGILTNGTSLSLPASGYNSTRCSLNNATFTLTTNDTSRNNVVKALAFG